jgi:hypothetical protein
VIVYLTAGAPRLPPWLADFRPADAMAAELCRRDTEHGHLVGIGNPLIFDEPPAEAFCDLDDGWRVALVGGVDPLQILRRQEWCRSRRVESLDGRRWQPPEILGADGVRDFLVAYAGRDFLPRLTPTQQRCEEVAKAAREMILGGGGIDMQPACRWAAILLSATHHVSPDCLAVLGLIDDRLAIGTLEAATSLSLKREAPAMAAGVGA